MSEPRFSDALRQSGRRRDGDGDAPLSGRAAAWDETRLKAALAEVPWVRDVVVLHEASSTNDVLRELAGKGAPEGTLAVADRQTAGRGRRGRSWFSPPGLGLYVSVLFRPAIPAAGAGRWTIAAAAAAAMASREISGAAIVIKWPNDLLWRGRKVGGSLVELRTTGEGAGELVVGTGINVYHLPGDFPPELRERAGSLEMAREGRSVDRVRLLAAYLRSLGEQADALRRGEWPEVARAWSALASGAEGARVRVLPIPETGGQAYAGTTRGIDDSGGLRVERDDGTRVTLHRGESVAPLEA